MKFEAVVHS